MATRPRRASWKRLQPVCFGYKLQTAEMAMVSFDTILVIVGFLPTHLLQVHTPACSLYRDSSAC